VNDLKFTRIVDGLSRVAETSLDRCRQPRPSGSTEQVLEILRPWVSGSSKSINGWQGNNVSQGSVLHCIGVPHDWHSSCQSPMNLAIF
jgi:hypothetical protein